MSTQDNQSLEKRIQEYLVQLEENEDVSLFTCVLSGSRAYGLELEDSDHDLLGIHMMNPMKCLIQPAGRNEPEIIKKRLVAQDSIFTELTSSNKHGDYNIDSFEMWKFIEIFLKGSPVSLELIHLPPIHITPWHLESRGWFKEGRTTRFARACRGIVVHKWGKNRNNLKKAIFAYYRLVQATLYLRSEQFRWLVRELFEDQNLPGFEAIHEIYMNPDSRDSKIPDSLLPTVISEISTLLDHLDHSMAVTALPDKVPEKVLKKLLERDQDARLRGLQLQS